MKKLSLTLFLLFCLFASNAQNYWSATPTIYPPVGPNNGSIAYDNQGGLYLLDFDIYKFNGSGFDSLLTNNNYGGDLKFDQNGFIWMVGLNYAYSFNPNLGILDSILLPSIFNINYSYSFNVDNQNNIWIAGINNTTSLVSLINVNSSTQNISIFNSPYQISNIGDVQISPSGIIWISGASGILKFNITSFTMYDFLIISPSTPIVKNITVMPNDDLYVNSISDFPSPFSDTLTKFDGNNWTRIVLPPSFNSRQDDYGMCSDNYGNLLIANDTGIFIYNGSIFTPLYYPSGLFAWPITGSDKLCTFNNEISLLGLGFNYLIQYNPAGINKLSGKVYLDQKCLLDGHDWEAGCIQGLCSSLVMICLLSFNEHGRGSVGDLTTLCTSEGKDRVDTVLLELILAHELRALGEKSSIFSIVPILVGPQRPDSSFEPFPMGSLGLLSEVPSVMTNNRAAAILAKLGVGDAQIQAMKVRSVRQQVDLILKNQGTQVLSLLALLVKNYKY
jgi:hypothetical protein